MTSMTHFEVEGIVMYRFSFLSGGPSREELGLRRAVHYGALLLSLSSPENGRKSDFFFALFSPRSRSLPPSSLSNAHSRRLSAMRGDLLLRRAFNVDLPFDPRQVARVSKQANVLDRTTKSERASCWSSGRARRAKQ